MTHHKRKRPKKQRAGCLFCKPHKGNGTKRSSNGRPLVEKRARVDEAEQRQNTGYREWPE